MLIADSFSKRVKGIEPSSSAWKAVALPLSYTRQSVEGGGSRVEGQNVSGSRLSTLDSRRSLGSAGFEPAKAEPSDLQSDPFDRFGNSPRTSATPCRAATPRTEAPRPPTSSPQIDGSRSTSPTNCLPRPRVAMVRTLRRPHRARERLLLPGIDPNTRRTIHVSTS